MMLKNTRHIDYILLAAIILFGFVMRFYGIGDTEMWLDEIYTFWFSGQTLDYLWREVPAFETHPPMYYTILHLWRSISGESEAALRSLSAIFSVITIPFIYLTVRIMIPTSEGRAMSLLAALLCAGWYDQIYHAQSARPYAFMSLIMAITLCGLIYIIQNSKDLRLPSFKAHKIDGSMLIAMITLAFGLAFLPWCHNLGIFFSAAISLYLIIFWIIACKSSKQAFMALLVIAISAFMFYAPNIPNIIMQSKMVTNDFWIDTPSFWTLGEHITSLYGVSVWRYMGAPPMDFLGKTFMWYNLLVTVVMVVMGSLGLLLLNIRANGSFKAIELTIALAFILFIPVLLSIIITYTLRPIFLPRTLIAVHIPLFITLASIPWFVPKVLRNITIIIICAIPLFITPMQNYKRLSNSHTGMGGTKTIIAHITQSHAPNAPIIVFPNIVGVMVNYYAKDITQSQIIHFPQPYPSFGDKHKYRTSKAIPMVSSNDVALLLNRYKMEDVIWIINRRRDLYDPAEIMRDMLLHQYSCRKVIIGNDDTALSLILYSKDPDDCVEAQPNN